MPPYNSAPGNPQSLLTSGVPAYCFGSFNDRVDNTKMQVTNVAITSNVATLTVAIHRGNIPAVGSLISVQGVPTSSGAFNVTQVPLTGVTIDAVTGIGTVTFALTHADVVSVASSGTARVQVPEVAEALVNGSSVAWSVPVQSAIPDQGRALKAAVSFPSIPTTATVTLQEAIFNQDSEFQDMATVASVTAGTVTGNQTTVGPTPGRFYRLHASSVTGGTSPTIIGKLLI